MNLQPRRKEFLSFTGWGGHQWLSHHRSLACSSSRMIPLFTFSH